jgi:hypothetical protein
VSATDCWAVGPWTVIVQCSGSGWAVVTSPPVPGTDPGNNFPSLVAGTCADPEECWAVGNTGAGDTDQPLAEEYTGSGWTVVASPHVSAPNGGGLGGIACFAPDDCWAVGAAAGVPSLLIGTPPSDASSPLMSWPLIEHYTAGRWTIAASTTVPNGGLGAITAVQPVTLWAVGGAGYPDAALLIETTP